MNHSKQLLTVLCCFVVVSFFTVNYAFAQGQGKGQGQGLLNNTGCENGKGFTTGQGHLNGKSAVDCVVEDPCLNEAIGQLETWIVDQGGVLYSTTVTSANTFVIYWDARGANGRGCVETSAEATGDPSTGCGYTNLAHDSTVPCP